MRPLPRGGAGPELWSRGTKWPGLGLPGACLPQHKGPPSSWPGRARLPKLRAKSWMGAMASGSRHFRLGFNTPRNCGAAWGAGKEPGTPGGLLCGACPALTQKTPPHSTEEREAQRLGWDPRQCVTCRVPPQAVCPCRGSHALPAQAPRPAGPAPTLVAALSPKLGVTLPAWDSRGWSASPRPGASRASGGQEVLVSGAGRGAPSLAHEGPH